MKSETKPARNTSQPLVAIPASGFQPQPSEAIMNPFVATQTRWMLVDDNQDILRMMSAVLESMTGAAIECHATPLAALAAFRDTPDQYELVITDFEMSGLNGLELCRQIHELSAAQKIILATGSGFFTEAAARHAGFSALLNKPFPMDLLKAALAKTLGVGVEQFSHDLIAA